MCALVPPEEPGGGGRDRALHEGSRATFRQASQAVGHTGLAVGSWLAGGAQCDPKDNDRDGNQVFLLQSDGNLKGPPHPISDRLVLVKPPQELIQGVQKHIQEMVTGGKVPKVCLCQRGCSKPVFKEEVGSNNVKYDLL